MADQHFTIKVAMKGVGDVVADAKVVKAANKSMADSSAQGSDRARAANGRFISSNSSVSKSTDSVSRSMRDNTSASEEMSRSHIGARDSSDNLGRSLVGTNAKFTALRNLVGTIKWPSLIAGAGYAVQGIGALGSAAVGLLGALAPLTGVLAAYPALFASLGQAAGVGALALGGIMNALGAMESQSLGAGEAAATTGKAVTSAAEGVVSAERSMTAAHQTERLAQQSLNLARNEAVAELKNLENASVSAALGEERATLSLRESKQALRKAEDTPGSSGLEIAGLELGVREARQSLHESRINSRRAHGEAEHAATRGVAHNPKVVESTRSLHEAQLGVTESAEGVQKAERAVGEAMEESGSKASTLAQKMAALPAAGQQFVKFLYGLKPKLDTLRQSAASSFLPGVEGGISKALVLFPKLNHAVSETGGAMGHLAERAGGLIGSKGFGKDFESITKSNTGIVEHLGDAGLHLAHALENVMVVSEPLVDWMAKSADGFASMLDAESKTGRETGTMGKFFEKTRSVLETVFHIADNLGHAFFNIGKDAAPLGEEILGAFETSSKGFEKWTSSVAGENSIKEYFAEAKPGIFEFGRLIGDATKDMVELSKGEGFFQLTRALRTELLPVLTEVVGHTTEAFGPALIKGLVQVGKLLGNLAGTSGPLTLFVEEVTSMIKLLNGAFEHIPGLKGFVITLAGIATASKALRFTGMVTGLSSASGVARKLLETMGLIEVKEKTISELKLSELGGAGGGVIPGVGVGTGRAASTVEQDAGQFGEKQALRDAGILSGGAAAPKVATSLASKLGFVGEEGIATGFGLATAGVGTFALAEGHELASPAKAGNPGLEENAIQRGAGLNFKKSKAELESLEKTFANTMGKIRSDAALGLGGIDKALGTGLAEANETWLHGTKPWREHTQEAMRAAIKEIHSGMEAGTIDVNEGKKEINQLLAKIHLEAGADPFGLADATAKQFKKANIITAGGVAEWTQKLEKMPPAARQQTQEATTAMLTAWSKGHPALEKQVENLTSFEIKHFHDAGVVMAGSTSGSMLHITESVEEGSTNVGKALENVFDNLEGALTAMGNKEVPHFSVRVLSAASAAHHAREETEAGTGKGKVPKKARGGLTTVPGRGREDTVPLLANGSVSAMVAPGEELMVVNRHQRPLLDYAVSQSLGVGGMEGFFGSHDRPHNFAKGGEVKANGSTLMSQLAVAAVTKASKTANHYLGGRRPTPGTSTGGGLFTGRTPSGTAMFQGFPVDKWIIPELKYAVAHGWGGRITSGYRTPAHSAELGYPGDEHTKKGPYPYGAVDFGGMHEAAATANRAAFLAATKGYRGPKLKLPIGFVDDGHMSGTGHARGGRVPMMAGGGFVGGGYTVKGVAADAEQMGTAEEIMRANDKVNAPYEARVAIMMAATQEEDLQRTNAFTVTSATGTGNRNDSAYEQAIRWQTEGYYEGPILGAGGGIEKSKKSSDPGLVAQEVEGSAYPTLYEQWKPEGQKWASGWSSGNAAAASKTTVKAEVGATGSAAKAQTLHGKFTKEPNSGGGVAVPELGHYKVSTAPLSFGSLPTDLPAIRKELRIRQREIAEYRAALGHAKKKSTKAALLANVEALKTRISELREAQAKVVRLRARAKTAKNTATRGEFKGIDKQLLGDEASYNAAVEYSGEVVALEPEKWSNAYGDKEGAAYSSELGAEATWRNHLLGADVTAAARIGQMNAQIATIEGYKAEGKTNAWNSHKYLLAPLRTSVKAAEENRGTWRETLATVQGAGDHGGPSSTLPGEPEAGSFGGDIWGTQMEMRELGIAFAQGAEAAKEEEEKAKEESEATTNEIKETELALLKEKNATLEREGAIHRAQEPVLADYLGSKLAGGVLPKDGYYFGHRGEEITKRGDTGTGAVTVLEPHIHVSDELAPYISATIEKRFVEGGQRVGIGLSTPTVAGQRANMKGGS